MTQHMLIVGGSGVTAQGAIKELATQQWRITTLSRHPLSHPQHPHITADLHNPQSLREHYPQLQCVSHIFYAALNPQGNPQREAEINGEMFRNIVEAVMDSGADLKRVIFLQGGKVYGAHLGIYKTPAREDDSRHFPPNLYFEHEDFAKTLPNRGIGWTALRPDIVIGHSLGSTMNLGNLIGIYGTLCKHLGVAMQFPGSERAYKALVNVTATEVLGKAVLWAAYNDKDGAFNITNGDQFRWQQLWPTIAQWFGISEGMPQPINLQQRLNEFSAEYWRVLAKEHCLAEPDINQLAQGAFGDFIFNVEHDAIFDVTKARQHGFQEMKLNSDSRIIEHLNEMVRRKLIPDPNAI